MDFKSILVPMFCLSTAENFSFGQQSPLSIYFINQRIILVKRIFLYPIG